MNVEMIVKFEQWINGEQVEKEKTWNASRFLEVPKNSVEISITIEQTPLL